MGVAQVGDGPDERRLVLRSADAGQHGDDAPGNVAGRRIEHGTMIGKWNFVERVVRVVGVEGGKPTILALHPHQPIHRSMHILAVFTGALCLMHGPHDDRGIIQIRIMRIGKLERPSAARHVGAVHAPIARLIAQLFGLEPVERARCGADRRRVTRLLHGKTREPGVPNRRYAGLAIGAGRPDHEQLLQGQLRGHAARIVLRVPEYGHRFECVDHGREDGTDSILTIQAL